MCEEYENESSVITIYRYEGILFTRIGTSGEKREVPDEQVVFYGKIDSSKIEVGMFTKEEVLSNIKENFDFSNEPLKDEVHDKWLEEIY